MTEKPKFNYVVGFYWPEGNGSVGAYNYFGEVHYGTLEDAKELQRYCQAKLDNVDEDGEDIREYRIFQLVRVPD